MEVPRLYAILDAEVTAARGLTVEEVAAAWMEAGVGMVQYRDKVGTPQEVLAAAAVLRKTFAGSGCRLVMNDRVDLAVLAGFDGVHVGQEDLSPEEVRAVARGQVPFFIGVSTHTEEQVRAADVGGADYVAIGPVFRTGTKADAAEVVGLDGVRRARALAGKPLVAIGGITRANARSVIEAGADAVAVISELMRTGERAAEAARDFLELLR